MNVASTKESPSVHVRMADDASLATIRLTNTETLIVTLGSATQTASEGVEAAAASETVESLATVDEMDDVEVSTLTESIDLSTVASKTVRRGQCRHSH